MTADNKTIKILIVDDSKVSQDLLSYIIDSDSQLKLIGCAESGEAALKFLQTQKPDVITMDIVMPNMDGFETTRRIIQLYPIPIVVISSVCNAADVDNSFKAIEAGALAILQKPTGIKDVQFSEIAKTIRDTLKIMSGVKVITRKYSLPPPHYIKPLQKELDDKHAYSKLTTEDKSKHIQAIAMGASLGGPQALNAILSQLPSNFPVPILIVQHIAIGFVQGLVDWLNSASPLHVCLATDGEIAKAGSVYIAPDKLHMEITKGDVIRLVDAPPEGGCRPSVARLFRSMAKTYGPYGVGIILTGMGRDGVADLRYMKDHGALTIAQHRDSCIMYGMPEEAIMADAAKRVLPLQEIAPNLILLAKNYSTPKNSSKNAS